LKLDEKKEVQILEVGTCWSLSIEFISETVRERGNQSTGKLLTQSIQKQNKTHIKIV
jgi:hypothetical protein